MSRIHTVAGLLTGPVLILVGWVLVVPLGGRDADPAYRSDEDLYTVLTVVGMLLILFGGVVLISGVCRMLIGLYKSRSFDSSRGSRGNEK